MPTPRRRATAAILKGSVLAGAALFVAVGLTRRFVRYEVSGESMAPALLAGDYLVVDTRAYRRCLPRPGHVVVARDPRDPSRELVKRVRDVEPSGAWIEGDSPASSTDSRVFGRVPLDNIAGRARLRYWPYPTRL